MYDPAVIWPYWLTPSAFIRSHSSCELWLGITIPFVTTTLGASGCDGKSPIGWPEKMVRVWDESISLKYFIVSLY